MVTSNSKLSFDDCFDAFDRALSTTKGIRMTFADFGAANHFRVRLHKARVKDREQNAETYEEDHPSHGTSKYDELIVRVREINGKGIIMIEKIRLNAEIEEIE